MQTSKSFQPLPFIGTFSLFGVRLCASSLTSLSIDLMVQSILQGGTIQVIIPLMILFLCLITYQPSGVI